MSARWVAVVPVVVALLAVQPVRGDETTEKSKQSVDKGVKWILAAQNKDGAWGLDMKTPTCLACTSLCGLALMSVGNHERSGADRDCVQSIRRALDYVMGRVRKNLRGLASEGANLIPYEVGPSANYLFVALFLSQACGMRDPSLSAEYLDEMRQAISAIADIIAKAQDPDGSWHKDTLCGLEATAMGWLALRSASSAGAEIKATAVDKTVQFMRKAYSSSSGHFNRMSRGGGNHTLYATSSALRVLYGMGRGDLPEARRGAQAFMTAVMKGGPMANQFLTSEGADFLCAALMTEAMMHEGNELWEKWFPYIRDRLIELQNGDGSWTSSGCISGRTFPTACAVITLACPYRLLPLHEH